MNDSAAGLLGVEWYEPDKLAEKLGIGVATLNNWRSRRNGPAYLKIARRIYYPAPEVERWLQAQLNAKREELKRESAKAALPFPTGFSWRTAAAGSIPCGVATRKHRFGRHRTKSEMDR